MMARLPVSAPRFLRSTWTFLGQLASFTVFSVRRFYAEGMGQYAGALTYSTLLALVPLTVLTFAILSGFPTFDAVRARIENFFFSAFVPEVGAEVQDYLLRFSENASNLTAVGLAALAVAAVLLLWTIEATLNQVWRVEEPRPLGVRLLIYWTVLTLGPLLLGLSFASTSGMLAPLLNWAQNGIAYDHIAVPDSPIRRTFTLLAHCVIFMLLFKVVPARPVRLREAAIGGAISGTAFEILRWGFNAFLTSGSTYQTIYGAVAVLPIFLVWIYSSWTVIIFGAVFASSFPDWWKTRDAAPHRNLSPGGRLEVAVAMLGALLAQSRKGGVLSVSQLQDVAPMDVRDDLINRLIQSGFVATTSKDCLILARDLHVATVDELARALDLALGEPPGEDLEEEAARRTLADIASHTGDLPHLLSELRKAEASILGRPLAAVIDGQPRRAEVEALHALRQAPGPASG